MNSFENSAPLKLLSNLTVSEAAGVIRASANLAEGMTVTRVGATGGQTFDIQYCGVAFVVSISNEHGNIAGFKKIFCNLEPSKIQSVVHIALGAHVAGGERVSAIIRTLLEVAVTIGTSCNALAAVWMPASVISGFDYFRQSVEGYLAGGAFPVLAMVAFKSGPGRTIASNGLATLSGQELLIDCGKMDEADMMRRAIRVAHDLAVNGPVNAILTLDGLEVGERLELEPVSGAALLKLKIISVPGE